MLGLAFEDGEYENVEGLIVVFIAVGILAIGESYPELKANENFKDLQNRISQLETTLSDRREIYNESVANFNTRIEQFPDILAANLLGYQRQTMFQVTEIEKQMPSVKMNLPKFSN